MQSIVAAAYARYSTSQQQDTSIEAQLDKIRIFCETNNLQLYPRPYVDIAFSGTNTDRPGFRALVDDARSGAFSAVVVYDISRGSRDVGDWFTFRKTMQTLGVKVYSCSGDVGNLDDPTEFLKELLSVGLGQHMVLQSRQKSIDGKRVRAKHGLFCGGVAPLGYSIDEEGHYVINPREAEAVRLIFARYASGASYGDIVAELDRMGFRSRNGRRLERNSLHDILRNRRYTGRYAWFEMEERHMHKHVGREGDDPIIIEDAIPRLVSYELFEIVQRRMDSRLVGKRGKHEYLLSGLIRCGECGGAMSGTTVTSKGHTYARYVCINKRTEKNCTLHNLKADVADKIVGDIIREKILNRDLFEDTADKIIAKFADRSEEMQAIRDELTALYNKTSRLIDMAAEYPTTPPHIKEKIIANEAQRVSLEARLAASVTDLPVSREQIIYSLEYHAKRLEDNAGALREMVMRYVDSVVVYEDRIDITINPFPDAKQKQPTEVGCKEAGSPGTKPTLFTTITIYREQIAA